MSSSQSPSGLCDSIITLLEKCNNAETELVRDVAQKQVYDRN